MTYSQEWLKFCWAGSYRRLMATAPQKPTRTDRPESPAPSRAPSRASANTKAFWSLMERWGIPDATALELIGFAGKIGKSGKRPRFRLNTHQVELLEYLQELDRTAETAHGSASRWLNNRQRAAPMNGRTPVQTIVQDGATVISILLRNLNREAMRKALKPTVPSHR
jgi:hypothetical protein